jgi:hypothetical protein
MRDAVTSLTGGVRLTPRPGGAVGQDPVFLTVDHDA